MPMSPRLLRPLARSGDSDVRAYIAAVEAADQQALEQGVKDAIRDFIVGCKQDGIWSAIRASCILMGARTLSGALTPLVGSAPTNVNNNFVSGDYNRKTGLVGNGSSKYLDTNRANDADPQDSCHAAVYCSEALPAIGGSFASLLSAEGGPTDGTNSLTYTSTGVTPNNSLISRMRSTTNINVSNGLVAGFKGHSRAAADTYTIRNNGSNTTGSTTSQTPTTRKVFVFAQNPPAGVPTNYLNSRLAYYSIGESLDLALLDSRVTTLYNAIGAAIP